MSDWFILESSGYQKQRKTTKEWLDVYYAVYRTKKQNKFEKYSR